MAHRSPPPAPSPPPASRKRRPPRARGNPEDSPWYGGGPREARQRVEIKLTLSKKAQAKLLALAGGSKRMRSAVVEQLIHAAARDRRDPSSSP